MPGKGNVNKLTGIRVAGTPPCALHLKYPPLRKSLYPAQFLRQDW